MEIQATWRKGICRCKHTIELTLFSSMERKKKSVLFCNVFFQMHFSWMAVVGRPLNIGQQAAYNKISGD